MSARSGSRAPDAAGLRDRLIASAPPAAADPGSVRVVRSPGRVNLIGEHTDYNDGFVLPAAIELEIRLAIVPTDDERVEIVLDADGDRAGFSLTDLPGRQGHWIDYIAATAHAMADAGLPRRGFRGLLASDLPASSGLSSSAAVELAAMWALSGGAAPPVGRLAAAQVAQRAENEYVGVRCGLMDQFAVACGRDGMALLLDCASLAWEPLPLPEDVVLVVAHTGSPRKLESSEYNARRADCELAVATIAREVAGVRTLRDVDADLLEANRERLDETAWRRASHVIAENDRVLATRAALMAGDVAWLGDLFAASHASLRELYEVSSPELDLLVEIAAGTPGVVAARMTGAGFGGCIVSLVHPDAVTQVRVAIEERYRPPSGHRARVWTVAAVDGVSVLA